MLEVAAATAARVEVGTARRHAFGARLEHLDGVAAGELRGLLGEGHPHALTRQGLTHEDHSPIGEVTDTPAGGRTLDEHFEVAERAVHPSSLLTGVASSVQRASMPQWRRN